MIRTWQKAALVLTLSTAAGSTYACGSEPYVGEVCTFAMNYCPQNYLPADGRILPVQQYQVLYSLIGNVYGGSQTTFALPDLRGRVAVGTGAATSSTSNVTLGQQRGQETIAITAANLPAVGVDVQVTLNAVQANGANISPNSGDLLAVTNTGGRTPTQLASYAPGSSTDSKVALGGVSATGAVKGNAVPVSTIPPELGLTACIAVNGLYPSRP